MLPNNSEHVADVIRTTRIMTWLFVWRYSASSVLLFVKRIELVCFFSCDSKQPAVDHFDYLMPPDRQFVTPILHFGDLNRECPFVVRFVPRPVTNRNVNRMSARKSLEFY